MNILILTQRENNPKLGGIEKVSYLLACEWDKLGHKVICLSLSKTSNTCEYLLPPSTDTYFLPFSENAKTTSQENIDFFYSLLRKYNIQIVLNQVSNILPVIELCGNVRKCAEMCGNKIKWITAVHYDFNFQIKARRNNFFIREKIQNNIKVWIAESISYTYFQIFQHFKIAKNDAKIFDRISKQSDKIVVLSEHLIPKFKKILHQSQRGKLCSIPNPIEYFKPTINLKKNLLLYVGRLELGLKRVDRLIKIWAQLEPEYPDWKFIIVGDGDYRWLYESMVRDLGLKNVEFTGFADPSPYYAESSLLCLSSSSEGFGMVLIEAQLYGCVPIAYASFDTLQDIIEHGINGYAITPFKQNEYIAHLRRLMSDDKLRKNMAEHGKQRIRQYDIKPIAKKWITLFENLISSNN